MIEVATSVHEAVATVGVIILVILFGVGLKNKCRVMDLFFAWLFFFPGCLLALGALLVAFDAEDAVTISSGVILTGLMGVVGFLAGMIRAILWFVHGKVQRSDAMALRHVDWPVLLCMLGLFTFAFFTKCWDWSVEGGGVVTSVLVSASIIPPLLHWPQYVPKLFGGLALARGTTTQRQEPERASTALDSVVRTANCGVTRDRVCETTIRAASDDGRVIWLVTDCDDGSVLGGFLAPPGRGGEGFESEANTAQVHMIYAMTDVERVRQAGQRNAATAGESRADEGGNSDEAT